MNEPRYSDLMLRREIIHAEWMRRVEENKKDDRITPFYGAGVILEKDGTLRMSAFNMMTRRPVFDLYLRPFSHEIEVITP